ncbi:MAG: hypothetical protein IJS74_01310, partial [Clostridia bacterium]|nr:hypothetical protein [Clostridia bacterium]
DGHSYLLYEFMPGLFGYTLPSSDNVPTVKNLTLENVEISGSYAAAVVSRAYVALNLENVKVMGGTVTSSGTAGGLVGRIEGYTNLTYSDPVVNIKDCYTVLNISANIAGGAVGYATNGTYGKETTLNIINYLGKNNINVIGLEKETDAGTDVSYPTYYKAIGGHVVGVTAIKNLNIINTIVLGDIVSYTKGAYMGAYIGAIGSIDPFVANSVNISVDACKHVGAMYYVFNKDLVVGGTIVGGTHASYVGMVNLSVNDKTFTNQTTAAIYYNNSTSISVSSQSSVSEDEKGTGDFDFNNEEYFADENYFNLNYAWSEENIKRFGFVVTFMLEDGTILKQQIVKDGASVEAPATNPTKESTAAYDFVFAGYDKDFSAIYKDTTIYAVFEPIVREYEVSYEDENGNLLAVMKLDFGASVDQDIKIEKEKSNLFVKYTFVRFGEKGQTVAGDMTVKPVYKTEITTFGVIVIVALISSVIISLYVLSKKRQYVR